MSTYTPVLQLRVSRLRVGQALPLHLGYRVILIALVCCETPHAQHELQAFYDNAQFTGQYWALHRIYRYEGGHAPPPQLG